MFMKFNYPPLLNFKKRPPKPIYSPVSGNSSGHLLFPGSMGFCNTIQHGIVYGKILFGGCWVYKLL